MNPVVYLPIESRNRELRARLLMAHTLLGRGFVVVIGFNQAVEYCAHFWPRGLYVLKGLNRVQREILQALKRLGHEVAALDEEALGIVDPWYICKDVDPEISAVNPRIFCQGRVQADSLRDLRAMPEDRLTVTGNPRMDLLRAPLVASYQREADTIRRQLGRFVLINTNSGGVNNIWGDSERYKALLFQTGWCDPKDPDDLALVEDHLEHDGNNLKAIESTVRLMAERRPDIAMILRPHPSENAASWLALAEEIPALRVVENSEPAPWILASEVMICTGCTTGMEAFVLGKPVISLVDQPDSVRHPGFFLCNAVSIRASSPETAVARTVDHIDGGINLAAEDLPRRSAVLAAHVAEQGPGLAADGIADAIVADYPGRRRDTTAVVEEVVIDKAADSALRGIVKTVKWHKARFSREDVEGAFAEFESLLERAMDIDVQDLGWSTFRLARRS